MKKLSKIAAVFLIFFLVIPTFAFAENFLEDDEILLDERLNPDGVREIFTTIDGRYYRKFIKDDEILDMETIKIFPTGLKDVPKSKDRAIGKVLQKKLKQRGIYALPSKLDHSKSPYLPPVGKQHENSCVGWSTGYYLRTYQQGLDIGWKVKDGKTINPSRVFSPTFIYNQINDGIDDGAYVEDAGDLLKRIGASPLKYFPYIPGDYWTQPGDAAIRAAYPHRIRDWRVIYTYNDSPNYIIQKTKEYLNTGDLLVAGIDVGFKFQYPMIDEYGRNIITTDNYAHSGHAVTIVGYDDNIPTPEGYGAFKLVNSYGDKWGDKGFAYITYDAYVKNVRAGYVFTDLLNTEFIPEIENIKAEPISPTKFRITFDEIEGVSGYRVLDENYRVLSNIYIGEYTETIDKPGRAKRYIQPFDMDTLGDLSCVEVDTRDIIQREVDTEVSEGVAFNIQTKGRGTLDVKVVDDEDAILFKDKLAVKDGLNTFYWDGLDLQNIPCPDGNYYLNVKDKNIPFTKESKIIDVTSYKNIYKDKIKSVDINLHTKSSGTLNIYIQSGNSKIPVSKDLVLKKGKFYNYNIDISKHLKNKDPYKTCIILKIY